MSQAVHIENVVKKYGDFVAVNDISLHIKEGEFFTLLGPSGCGKTTLLRMIAGFNSIEAGEIKFNDKVINHTPAHKRNIGMVFQNYAIFPHLTVAENVAYGLKARNIKGKEAEERVMEAMQLMQIEEYKDRRPSQLSGGQQQRVALARAIVIHPSVLLMDEPLSNLDAKLRVQMRSSIKKLQKSLNITTIYVTHDQEEALAISDRIAVMNKGIVEQVGEPKEIYTHPSNVFVANFIGTSAFLDAQAQDNEVTILGRKEMHLPLQEGYNGKVQLSVRPEYAFIAEPNAEDLLGTVVLSTFLGDFVTYEIQLDGGPIIDVNEYMDSMNRIHKSGDRVSVRFREDRVTVFDAESQRSIMAD